MFIDSIVDEIIKKGIKTDEIKGCSNDEILELEKIIKHRLPDAYKEFLLVMGHGAGYFLCDEYMNYKSVYIDANCREEYIHEINEELKEFDVYDKSVPDDAFFFSYDSSEYHRYFRLNDSSQNPKIYNYYDLEFYNEANTFTEFLSHRIKYITRFIYKAEHPGLPYSDK